MQNDAKFPQQKGLRHKTVPKVIVKTEKLQDIDLPSRKEESSH